MLAFLDFKHKRGFFRALLSHFNHSQYFFQLKIKGLLNRCNAANIAPNPFEASVFWGWIDFKMLGISGTIYSQ